MIASPAFAKIRIEIGETDVARTDGFILMTNKPPLILIGPGVPLLVKFHGVRANASCRASSRHPTARHY